MACVEHSHITGDNDTAVFPEEKTTYYFYCDNCGSFNLETMMVPENFRNRQNQLKQWSYILYGLIAGVVLSALSSYYLMGGLFLAASIALYFYKEKQQNEIKSIGASCKNCDTDYLFEDNSSFFDYQNNNPRNFTIEDVPRPLNQNYFR